MEEAKKLMVVEEEIRTTEKRQTTAEAVEETTGPVPVEETLMLEMGEINRMGKVAGVVEVVEAAGLEEEEKETTLEEGITIVIETTTKAGEVEEGEDEVLVLMIQIETMAAEVQADEDKQMVDKFPLPPLSS